MRYAITMFGVVGVVAAVLTTSSRVDADAPKGKDLAEIVDGAAEFSTLSKALAVSELTPTLKGDGPFTVFAPTDDAFDALGAATVKSLVEVQKRLNPNFKKLLKDDGHLHSILTYHVVAGQQLQGKDLPALAKEGKTLVTVNGAKIKLSLDGDKIRVGGAVVTKTDIVAKNGVIHVLDAVLLPPAPSLNIPGRKLVPACPPADEPFLWQRATTLASPKSDRERLATLWKRAAEQEPPKGDMDKWEARVGELVTLAERYAGAKDRTKAADAASALVQKANCIGCHAQHQKGPFDRR